MATLKEKKKHATRVLSAISTVQEGLNELVSCIDITDGTFDESDMVGEIQSAFCMVKGWKEPYQKFLEENK